MKISRQLLISLVGAVMAAGMAIAGCGTTNNYNGPGDVRASELGESCTRTADCKSGLVCGANVCLTAASTSIDASTTGGEDGGTEAAAPPGPHLGLLRESCQKSSDCQAPLECVNNECSIVSYGLTSTGKSCAGECNTAADCCQLPVNLTASLSYWYSSAGADAGLTTYHPAVFLSNTRCQDLLAYLGGDTMECGKTTFAGTQPGLAQACFLYATYCQCAASTWTCTNNQCAYAAPCEVPAIGSLTSSQCPAQTRTKTGLSTTCSVVAPATTGTCLAGCATASDCIGKVPAMTSHLCSGTDAGTNTNCTCYQSACYFACTRDIDCAGGSTCDATTHLCKAAGCTTNSDCVRSLNNPRGQCVAGVCALTCSTDIECTPPATICSGGFCKASGCNSDTDCTGAQHLFCVTATSTTYTSAITN
jgi:hypothetical protein